MQHVYAHALSKGRAAVASFKPTRLDPPCKDAHDHVTYRYERALSWAAVASERGRMTASIAESRRHLSPECGEQRPSKNIVRIISTLLWYFPNRPGAAGWLHLATYRHECARVMCILWAVHLGLGSRGVSPSFSGGWRWGCGARSRFPGGAPASGPAPFFLWRLLGTCRSGCPWGTPSEAPWSRDMPLSELLGVLDGAEKEQRQFSAVIDLR